MVFISTFKEILEAANNVNAFNFYSWNADGQAPQIDWGKSPTWNKRDLGRGAKISGGHFNMNNVTEELAAGIYENLIETHGDAAKRHWGDSPATLFLFMIEISIWSYSKNTAGALGVQSGQWNPVSSPGKKLNDRDVKNTPWGYVPQSEWGRGGLKINSRSNARPFPTTRAAFIKDQINGMNTTYAHEYRHAYQSIFIVPQKLKKTYETDAEAFEAKKEYFDSREGRRALMQRNQVLPPNVRNIFDKIFTAEQKRTPAKGKGKRARSYEPGEAYTVIITSAGRGRDKWQKEIVKIAFDGLVNIIKSGSGKDVDIAKGMLRSMAGKSAYVSGNKFRSDNPGMFSVEIPKDERDQLPASAWPANARYVRFPYNIVRIEDAQKSLNRGERMFYIFPASSGQTAPEGSWRKKPARAIRNQQMTFRDLRGLDFEDSEINLTGDNANSGQKWANQPTEFDADFTAALYKYFNSTIINRRNMKSAMEMIDFALDSDHNGIIAKIQTAIENDISRFIGGWGGADARHKKVYKKRFKQRLNAFVDKIIIWAADNWPDDLDPENFPKNSYGRINMDRIDATTKNKIEKSLKKMVQDIF